MVTFWFLVSAISSAMERPSLLSPLNGDEKRLTTVPQRTVSLLCETDAKQASVQLLKRQALGVWHADALSDVENAIGDLHFWPTTWSKDPRSRDYDMQRLGRSKRLDNRERFELFRFVVGNGASPALAVTPCRVGKPARHVRHNPNGKPREEGCRRQLLEV